MLVLINEGNLTATNTKNFGALSSIRDDVWHGEKKLGAYEWWYFDAVSTDGRELIVVIFLDGFIFSPRYNREVKEYLRGANNNQHNDSSLLGTVPAMAISLYRDGRLVWRAINEYETKEFAAREDRPECRIGSNSFKLETRTGENVYNLQLDSALRGGRRLQGALTWTVQQGNFSSSDKTQTVKETSAHVWNLVAPKCRVAGTICVVEKKGVRRDERQWTGTGYHDHNLDSRWMPATIAEWQWGRAHFGDDTTVIFYRYRERESDHITTRFYVVREGSLKIYEPHFAASDWRRHLFGLRYPRTLRMQTNESSASQLSLRIEQQQIVDGSFFYLRFTGEAHLDSGDGHVRRAVAVTEQLAPRALEWRGLWWLTGMRIGQNNCAAFLP